jgi:hypothetical protein
MFEAYKIGITLSLVDHVSHGLMSLSRGFHGAEADAKKVQKALDGIHAKLVAGTVMTAAGVGIMHMFKTPLEEAKKFNQETARFTALGLGDAISKDAIKTANSLDLMGQSATDTLHLLRELTGITGSYEHAKEMLPMVAKTKFAIEAYMGPEGGAGFENQLQALIKTGELRGVLMDKNTHEFTPEAFKSFLNMTTQAYVASGGMVKPTDYLAAMKTGGVSTKMMSQEMFLFGLGHFMQESGGNRTGTAAMTMFSQMAQGTISGKTAEKLIAEHLLDPKFVKKGTFGQVTVDPHGIKNLEDFVKNPFKWTNETVVPQLKANGHKDGMDMDLALASLYGVRTAKGLSDAFMREAPLAEQYIKRARQAANTDQLADIGKNSAYGKELELHAKWAKLMSELGTTILPMAIKGTETLIGIIKPMSEFVQRHPTAATAFVYSLITLGGVLAVAGIATNVMAVISLLQLLGGGSLAGAAAGAAGSVGAGLATAARGGLYGAAAVAGAAGGWYAGKWLGDTLGTWAAKKYYDGKDSVDYMTPAARARMSSMQKPASTTVNLNVDGKKLATVTVDHLGRQISRPDGGTSHPDYNQSAPKPAGGYSK